MDNECLACFDKKVTDYQIYVDRELLNQNKNIENFKALINEDIEKQDKKIEEFTSQNIQGSGAKNFTKVATVDLATECSLAPYVTEGVTEIMVIVRNTFGGGTPAFIRYANAIDVPLPNATNYRILFRDYGGFLDIVLDIPDDSSYGNTYSLTGCCTMGYPSFSETSRFSINHNMAITCEIYTR